MARRPLALPGPQLHPQLLRLAGGQAQARAQETGIALALHGAIPNPKRRCRAPFPLAIGMQEFDPFHQGPGLAPMRPGIHGQTAPHGTGNSGQKLHPGEAIFGSKVGQLDCGNASLDHQLASGVQLHLVQAVGKADDGAAQPSVTQ